MSSTQEDDDLALAMALSNSLAVHNPPEVVYDPQALAFFTDLPINSNSDNNCSSNNSYIHSQNRKQQSLFDEDAAFANRLQTEEDARKRAEDTKQLAKDSQFAKDLYDNEQRSLVHDSPKADSNDNAKLKAKVSNYTVIKNSKACSYCKKSLIGPYKVVETQLKLHPHCFLCAGCTQPILDAYIKKGALVTNDIEFYHSTCNVELFAPDCDLCGNKLAGRYNTHGFFTDKQKFCTFHNVQTEHRSCTSCNLIEPNNNNVTSKTYGIFSRSSSSSSGCGSGSGSGGAFHTLPDGRAICPECVSYIILESTEAKELYLEAVDFMEHVLGLSIPAYMRAVPVMAVDVPSLNDQSSLNRHICTAHPPVQLPSNDSGSLSGSSGNSTGQFMQDSSLLMT